MSAPTKGAHKTAGRQLLAPAIIDRGATTTVPQQIPPYAYERRVMATGLTMCAKRSLCLADVAYPFDGECDIRHPQPRHPRLRPR